MIIAGFPVEVRSLHHLLWWWLRYLFLRSVPLASSAKLNFLYFSYAPDYPYLLLSMRSLKAGVDQALIGNVFLIIDQKAPFSEAQITSMRELFPQLETFPIHNFEWGAARSTLEEIEVFKKVSSRMGSPFDFLVKVDSDVIFLESRKWARLLFSDTAAIGDGHFLDHKYAQGGLYMLRRHLIESVFQNVDLGFIESVTRTINSVGEDMAISWILRNAGKPFFFTRLMLFPDEYRKLQKLGHLAAMEFVALHCHKDKQNMDSLASKFVTIDSEPS